MLGVRKLRRLAIERGGTTVFSWVLVLLPAIRYANLVAIEAIHCILSRTVKSKSRQVR
jgi:hypothetical protein